MAKNNINEINKQIYFGKNLKWLMKRIYLKPKDVAEYLNVSTSTVYYWMAGDTIPNLQQIYMVAKRFDTSIDALCFDDFEKRKSAPGNPMKPKIPRFSFSGEKICPNCYRSLKQNGNDGPCCKFCGQRIAGNERQLKTVTPMQTASYEDYDEFIENLSDN